MEEAVGYLQTMGALYSEEYLPFFFSSVACHIANLRNKVSFQDSSFFSGRNRAPFYWKKGKPFDLRMHILFVAPPGWMKTFFIERMIDDELGFVSHCGFPTLWRNTISEPGLVGSGQVGKDGRRIKLDGDAELYKSAIIGFEEASSILDTHQTYNESLANQLLTIMDSGRVQKRNLGCSLDYITYLTLWMGTQATRLNLGSGIVRRLFALSFFPDGSDYDTFRDAYFAGINKFPSSYLMELIRDYTKDLYDNINIERIAFCDDYQAMIRQLKVPHYELDIFDRFAIGYNFWKNYDKDEPDEPGTMTVGAVPGLRNLIQKAVDMRYEIKDDAVGQQILKLLDAKQPRKQVEIREDALKILDMSAKQVDEIMQSLMEMGRVKRKRTDIGVTYTKVLDDDPVVIEEHYAEPITQDGRQEE